MIKLADAVLLAFTKLRTKKLRTIITIVLAGLLFGVLVAASLMVNGLFSSVNAFRQEGLTSRYIVSVLNKPADVNGLYKIMRDPQMIAEAKQRYEDIVKRKTAEAKRLGLEYSHINDQLPYSQGSDGVLQLSINDPNGITQQLLKKHYNKEPAFNDIKLEKLAKQYGAINTFAEESYAVKKGSKLVPLTNGKETFYDSSNEVEVNANYTIPPVNDTQLILAPDEITKMLTLSNNAGWKPDGSSLPIILPQNSIEQLLNLEKLPNNASASQKLERLKFVREHVNDLQFKMCYRNDVSQAQIQQALQQKKEIAANQDKKDYQKPKLIYDLPDPAACQNAVIASDERTPDEKNHDEKQKQFDETFGKVTTPISKMVTFKVVGMSPGSSEVLNPEQEKQREKSRTASDIVNDMLRVEGIGQAIPLALYNIMPNKEYYADIFTYEPAYLLGNEDNKRRFVEFVNTADAQKFIDEQGCTVQYDNTCKPAGNPYQAALAFSNSAALDDTQRLIQQWLFYVMVCVMILATVIMWIAIGRTVVDGRHETAVFRAIGFKRGDIVLIYTLYTVMLSLLVVVFAVSMGLVAALILNNHIAPILTVEAQYGFGMLSGGASMNLIEVNSQQIGIILAACFAVGLLSAIPPLVRNVHRSPIRDMRGSD